MTDKGYSRGDVSLIMAAVAGSFIALRDGSNRVSDFNTLAGAVNIGLVRSEGMDMSVEAIFRNAQQALLRADQIFDSLRVYSFTPADLVDLAKAVQGYGEMLQTSSEKQMKAAIEEADRRLATGLHARLPGSTH